MCEIYIFLHSLEVIENDVLQKMNDNFIHCIFNYLIFINEGI